MRTRVAERQFLFSALATIAFLIAPPRLLADRARPLHLRIDAAISAATIGSLAEPANDYEFLRRLYLDFVGRIPSTHELRSFIADSHPGKRAQSIDKLLDSREFNDHFVRVLDVMLMERRGGVRIPQDEWLAFLKKAIRERWSFDQIVTAVVTADGFGEQRGAAKFLLERAVEPAALTRDVGRIFLGRDLQCAQCHDHPNIADYEQSEYYGIYAFVNRSYLFEDASDNKKAYVGEKADGETEFQSVFAPEDGTIRTIPKLLDGLVLDVEPKALGNDAYLVAPTKTSAGVPRFSRRAQLARFITHPQNEHFAKNIVNRLWAHLLGRGFVHPVDFHHSENPPSHPAVLKLLADEFVATRFDYRELIRQIALSETYQRAIDFPLDQDSNRELDRQVVEWQQELAKQESDIDGSSVKTFQQELTLRRKKLTQVDGTILATSQRLDELKQESATTRKAITAAAQQLAKQQTQLKALDAAAKATQKASETLPKDEGVVNSAKELQQRAVELQQRVADQNASIKQRKQQQHELSQEILERERYMASLRSDRVGWADMVAEARGAISVFTAQKRRSRTRRAELKDRLTAAGYRQTYWNRWAERQSVSESLKRLARKATLLQQEQSLQNQAISRRQERLVSLRVSLESSQTELANLETSLEEQNEAKSGLQLVLQELTRDEQLTAVSITETDRLESRTETNEVRITLSVLQKKLEAVNEKVRALEAKIGTVRMSIATQQEEFETIRMEQTRANTATKSQKKELANLLKKRTTEQERLQIATRQLQAAEQALHASWQRHFIVRPLTPLTPEQLAGATIKALELDVRYRIDASNEWEKNQKNRDREAEAKDSDANGASESADPHIDEQRRSAEIEALYRKRIDNVVNTYVSMFAAPGGAPQDVFAATADQALFFSNDGRVQNWLSPAKGTLLKRLQSIESTERLADELYLSILTRPATDAERTELERYLMGRDKDRNQALKETAWGLLSSLEFRFNH